MTGLATTGILAIFTDFKAEKRAVAHNNSARLKIRPVLAALKNGAYLSFNGSF
jgi:hypothetical protein